MCEQILRFLGTGSSFNVNKSNNSAYLIDKNHLLLIDCGCTIFDEIVKSEILESITTVDILITHLHDDHVGSLSSLLHYIHFVKPLITKTKVYFMNNKLETLLSIMGTHEFEYEFVKIKPNVCFTIQGSTKEYKVLPVKVNHVDEISLRNDRKESFDSLGYKITFDKKRVLYTGDTNELFPNAIELLQDEKVETQLYQDVSEFKTSVHYHYLSMINDIPEQLRNKVYCMHIDFSFINMKEYGFNIVEKHQNNLIIPKEFKFKIADKELMFLPCTLEEEDRLEIVTTTHICKYDTETKKFIYYEETCPDDILFGTIDFVATNLKEKSWIII